jgi:hypothetical protein
VPCLLAEQLGEPVFAQDLDAARAANRELMDGSSARIGRARPTAARVDRPGRTRGVVPDTSERLAPAPDRDSGNAAALAPPGFGAFIGNAIMGIIFGTLFMRWRRANPMVIAHFLIDAVAFIGYALLAPHVSSLP